MKGTMKLGDLLIDLTIDDGDEADPGVRVKLGAKKKDENHEWGGRKEGKRFSMLFSSGFFASVPQPLAPQCTKN